MKFIIILIILIIQSACEKGGFKINQVIDKEQLYKFKAKSKIYSLKDNEFANITFIEYAQYEFIAKNIVKKKCLEYIKEKKLKNKKCKFLGVQFTDRILTSID
jgi:hypothetical protein